MAQAAVSIAQWKVAPILLCGTVLGLSVLALNRWLWAQDDRCMLGRHNITDIVTDLRLAATDPALFKKHSTRESYTTESGFVYTGIRTFYKEHLNRDKLPKDIPLLVFTHGLGGNATQFLPLLNTLINNGSCLAIDFPGCGLSDANLDDPKAYTMHELAVLLASAILKYRDSENNQQVVLIGHSMGCSINVLLGSSTSPLRRLCGQYVIGMVAICPQSGLIAPEREVLMRRMSRIPATVLAFLRWIDRRGGLRSASINRVVGQEADDDTRKKQQLYNFQSNSIIFLRMLAGTLGPAGWPGREIWSGTKIPLHLIAGEADTLTPAEEAERIATWLHPSPPMPDADDPNEEKIGTSSTESEDAPEILKEEDVSSKHAFALKTTIFSSPASHALLYNTVTIRALAGFIEAFLSAHVDKRLGSAWQLQHMATSGKWDVKNLAKWKSVDPCSEPIGGIFRVMKTMREVDDEHSPKVFVSKYSSRVLPDGVRMVVDISHETPVYDPKGLEEGGVSYHKLPTVSKQVPQEDEIRHFIKLIDELREIIHTETESAAQSESGDRARKDSFQPQPSPCIAVHCHYGKNRSGYLVVCYLVERCGYKLEDAMAEFAAKRPKGIKHEHFKNQLFIRYAVHMRGRARANTILG